ncbi:hypothetical protein GCM10009865_09010 [Aeromicrobium ponti]|uniref:DDE family transposase n=1 Tax=Cytobacillus oceanisediminis TaxID=665099 RepID=A0A562K2V6_9BACI|nr:DDE family transposase [Cytobacillus oceanisediminis]
MKTGVVIKEVYGDKAYFKKPILDNINEIKAKPYIPISAMAYRIDEDQFKYNKGSDEWFCVLGNKTESKKYYKDKRGKDYYKYSFEKEQCRNCPLRENCIKEKRVGKILEISINTPEFYGYSQEQKTEEFKEKYRKRACQEWKNGEMKNFHGLDRARGYGLKSMALQAKLTALAVNLKRIASLLSSQNSHSFHLYLFFFTYSKIISFLHRNQEQKSGLYQWPRTVPVFMLLVPPK